MNTKRLEPVLARLGVYAVAASFGCGCGSPRHVAFEDFLVSDSFVGVHLVTTGPSASTGIVTTVIPLDRYACTGEKAELEFIRADVGGGFQGSFTLRFGKHRASGNWHYARAELTLVTTMVDGSPPSVTQATLWARPPGFVDQPFLLTDEGWRGQPMPVVHGAFLVSNKPSKKWWGDTHAPSTVRVDE